MGVAAAVAAAAGAATAGIGRNRPAAAGLGPAGAGLAAAAGSAEADAAGGAASIKRARSSAMVDRTVCEVFGRAAAQMMLEVPSITHAEFTRAMQTSRIDASNGAVID